MIILGKPVYKAALVGCGRIGSILEDDPLREKPCTHAGAFNRHNRIELVAGCDTSIDRLESFSHRWKVDSVYRDYRTLLESEEIDILSIATDIKSHHNIVTDAARYNIPVIICEKPIAMSLLCADNMIRECNNNRSFLLINHERRFSSDYHFVKKLINRGDIGDLRSIRASILTGVPKVNSYEDYGGPLLHDGTHLVDIIRFLTDSEFNWVMADMSTIFKVEDTVTGIFKLSNGISGFIESGGRRSYFSFELDIHGTDGRVIIGNGILRLFKLGKSTWYSGFKDLIEESFPKFDYTPQFSNEMDSIVSYLDGGVPPSSTGLDGYRAIEVIFAFYKSACDGKVVYLPLVDKGIMPLKEYFDNN